MMLPRSRQKIHFISQVGIIDPRGQRAESAALCRARARQVLIRLHATIVFTISGHGTSCAGNARIDTAITTILVLLAHNIGRPSIARFLGWAVRKSPTATARLPTHTPTWAVLSERGRSGLLVNSAKWRRFAAVSRHAAG
jgi:hypothetical protein